MGTITYTQHTVAFPRLPLDATVTDELLVSNGEGSEFTIAFHTFGIGNRGVQLQLFGDGLPAFDDERVQRVMDEWRKLGDSAIPAHFIGWLEAEGAVPSEYHLAKVAAR